tara:strand:+ start:207 stop:338 length:132 start_codon:yes stop_codon:yes gene_type:complete
VVFQGKSPCFIGVKGSGWAKLAAMLEGLQYAQKWQFWGYEPIL